MSLINKLAIPVLTSISLLALPPLSHSSTLAVV